jgi:hypothetical protein
MSITYSEGVLGMNCIWPWSPLGDTGASIGSTLNVPGRPCSRLRNTSIGVSRSKQRYLKQLTIADFGHPTSSAEVAIMNEARSLRLVRRIYAK